MQQYKCSINTTPRSKYLCYRDGTMPGSGRSSWLDVYSTITAIEFTDTVQKTEVQMLKSNHTMWYHRGFRG